MGMRLARLRASDHPLGRQKVHFAFISVSHSVGEWPLFAQSESARSSKAWRSTRAHKGAGCGLVARRMRRHRGTEDWRVVSTPFQFSSRSGRRRGVGGKFAVASSAFGLASGWARVPRRRWRFTKKGVEPTRCRIAIESSRGSLRRVERPSAAGTRNGSGRGRLPAAHTCRENWTQPATP